MLTTPFYPMKQSNPKNIIAFVGVITEFLFITLGLIILP
jgi:hypothetical protein